MDPNAALGQVRPILQLLGSALAAAALLKFFGVNAIPYPALELAVAAWAAKAI